MKIVSVLLVFVATMGATMGATIQDQGCMINRLFPEFNCTNKPDGHYYHPTDCHKFASCCQQFASEWDCAPCHVHPVNCPTGRLVFNKAADACLWANETPCHTNI